MNKRSDSARRSLEYAVKMRFTYALLFASIAIVSCTDCQADEPHLKPGTRVKLTVQRTLSTYPKGGVLGLIGVKPITRENTLVVYEVSEDVLDAEGKVVIAAGSPATGTVIDSQVGGGLKPHAPRLAATVDRVLAVDGQFIPLRFMERHEGKWAFTFGRAETGAYMSKFSDHATEKIFAKPENSSSVNELFELVVHGNVSEVFRHPDKALKLHYLADRTPMPTLARYIQDGRILELASLIAEIQTGSLALRGLADARHLLDAFHIMDDTFRAGNQLVGWLYGRVKAPQILVPAGFPLEAVVAD